MNSIFIFKFRRLGKIFWTTKKVSGHKYHQDMDRMDLFLVDGGIHSIPKWSECELVLGADWKRAIEKQLEQNAGQKVPVL